MHRLWASDNDTTQECGKKYKRIAQKSLKPSKKYDNIVACDI
jgi:hypothetical protein